ncbi:MAG: response regulator [Planctomycetes bacterium]|nr:response regulator [Planctomycetota bacterium]MBI3836053.1 response regulator [Planctomycetota bacterium]
MSKILVVDDMALCREPIAESLRRHGHEAICAASGMDALALAREHRPDLILLDMNMPGMDGLTTLSALRQQTCFHDTPVLLLTDRSDREGIIGAGKYGVQGYLLKSTFSLDDLFARIDKCLCHPSLAAASRPTMTTAGRSSATTVARATTATGAPTSRRPPVPVADVSPIPTTDDPTKNSSSTLTGDKLLARICKHLELKPLGVTVQNVIAASSSAACSVEDIARAAAPDQALCIRLLRVANSSAYRRGQSVSGVKAAVQRLGIQEVRSLVMTLDVLDNYASAAGSRIDPRLFWEHALACGLIAGGIAKARQAKAADAYFLWGILHDLGRLILMAQLTDRYAAVCDAAQETAQPLEKIESQSLLLDHCDVLEKALEHWKFPREFIVPVIHHHSSMEKMNRLEAEHRDAAATIALANRVAHAMLLGDSGDETICPFDELVDLLRLRPSAIPPIVAAVPTETNDLKVAMLARTETGSWPSFCEKTRARLTKPVRALCVSNREETDAYRLFFESFAPTPAGKLPNIGVFHLRDKNQQDELMIKFEHAERNAGAKDIPILFIVDNDSLRIDENGLQTRKHRVLTSPVCISTILSAIEILVAAGG